MPNYKNLSISQCGQFRNAPACVFHSSNYGHYQGLLQIPGYEDCNGHI